MTKEQQALLIAELKAKGHTYDEIDEVLSKVNKMAEEEEAPVKPETPTTPATPTTPTTPTEPQTDNLAKQVTSEVMKAVSPLLEYLDYGLKKKADVKDVVIKSLAYPGRNIAELDKKEKLGEYYHALIKYAVTKDPEFQAQLKALSEGSDADGGYLVPDYFQMSIIEYVQQQVGWRTLATIWPMAGKTLELPKLASRPKVQWAGENVTNSTTSVHFGNLLLTAKKMIARQYASSELAEDSIPNISEVLTRLFAQAILDEENRVFTNGNGTTRPKGILQETLRGFSAGRSLTGDHIVDIMETYLPSAYQSRATWQMSQRVWGKILTLKTTTNDYLFRAPENVLSDGAEKRLMGRPVVINDEMSSNIVLGDFSYYYIGDRRRMAVTASTEADNTFIKDQIQLKVTERVAGLTALTQPFVKISLAI